jgi:uncharacterized repeat protein (TIGR03803 family)
MVRSEHPHIPVRKFRLRTTATLSLVAALFLLSAVHSAQAQTFSVLYSFQAPPDGNLPLSGVIRDADGNLYGTDYEGGTYGYGTVFKVDRQGNETVLYNFAGGGDGEYPVGNPVRDAAGNLYGATDGGGNPDCGNGNTCGTVYKIDPQGNKTVLYRFGGLPDGHSADSGLILDEAGNLYGTTEAGGDNSCNPGYGCGIVFKIDQHGKETILHTFTGTRDLDGAFPDAGLVAAPNGYLYGTTTLGGAPTCISDAIPRLPRGVREQPETGGCGTVFKIDKKGTEIVVHRFSSWAGGGSPSFPLIFDEFGSLYGTGSGGSEYNGVVFTMNKRAQEKVLYNFSYDQGYPSAGVVRDNTGNLYSTTREGGSYYEGTVYKLDKAGNLTILHAFTGGSDGGFPDGTLVLDKEGNLYGTARDGGIHDCGQYGCGVVFKIAP